MRAGALDRRIRVEWATVARDSTSREQVLAWPPDGGQILGEVWAERLPAAGREVYTAQQRVATISAGWRVRWQPPLAVVTPSERFRIMAEERVYDIAEVREEGRREALLFFGIARAE